MPDSFDTTNSSVTPTPPEGIPSIAPTQPIHTPAPERGSTPPFLSRGVAPSTAASSHANAPETAAPNDEEQAVRSLDDTATQLMPSPASLWEAVEEGNRPPHAQAEPTRPSRVRTVALVCVVAVVSFVAGGVVSRLSSQVPVLFAEKPEVTESVASYVEQPQKLPDEPDSTEPPEETTYDDSDLVSDDTSVTIENESEDEYEPTWQWYFDNNGDNGISYDYDDDQVTIDYDGYTLTVPIGDLIGYNQQDTTYDDYGTQGPSYRERTYGYDDTNEPNQFFWNDRETDTFDWFGDYVA